jgi:hypothetical protein
MALPCLWPAIAPPLMCPRRPASTPSPSLRRMRRATPIPPAPRLRSRQTLTRHGYRCTPCPRQWPWRSTWPSPSRPPIMSPLPRRLYGSIGLLFRMASPWCLMPPAMPSIPHSSRGLISWKPPPRTRPAMSAEGQRLSLPRACRIPPRPWSTSQACHPPWPWDSPSTWQ